MEAGMKKAERPLTPKEEAFCLEYARCWSAGAAAERAGYKYNSGYALLRDPGVRWRIRELAKEYAAEVHVEAGSLLREMLFLAHFDVQELFDEGGHLKPLRDIPEYVRRAITSLEVETTYVGEDASGVPISTRVTKVKLASKERALEMLGKNRQLFGEDAAGVTEKRVSITINAK
jgi:phage terminase small subunit